MNKYLKLPNWRDQEKAWLKSASFRHLAQKKESDYQLNRKIIIQSLQKS